MQNEENFSVIGPNYFLKVVILPFVLLLSYWLLFVSGNHGAETWSPIQGPFLSKLYKNQDVLGIKPTKLWHRQRKVKQNIVNRTVPHWDSAELCFYATSRKLDANITFGSQSCHFGPDDSTISNILLDILIWESMWTELVLEPMLGVKGTGGVWCFIFQKVLTLSFTSSKTETAQLWGQTW